MTPTETALVPAQAVPESAKAVTKFTKDHANEIGLPSPESINFMTSVANLLTRSALITPDMGNDPETIKANAIAKMLVGRGLGITDPMQALQDIYIVKGKIFVGYPQMIGIMLRKGFQLEWKERTATRACLMVTPPPSYPMMAEEFEYTLEDAKKAGLVRQGSQYEMRPRVMLSARVVSEAYRSTGGGSVYDPGEREDIDMVHDGDGGYHASPPPPAKEENPFTVTAAPKPASPPADCSKPEQTKAPVPPASNTAFAEKAAELNERAAEESSSRGAGDGNPVSASPTAPPAAGETQVAEPPPTEPARAARGRGKAKPEPSPAPPAPSNIVEMPKSGYRATDDDVPFGPTTAPPAVSQLERINLVVDRLSGAPRPANTQDTETEWFKAKVKVQGFLKGFLNTSDRLPVPQNKLEMDPEPKYMGAIPVLEALAASKPKDIQDNANMAGLQAGVGYNDLLRHIDKEWPDMKALALEAALSQYADKPSDLIGFVTLKGEPAVTGPNLRTFLEIVKRSKAVAGKIRTFCKENSVEMVDLMVGLDLAKCPEGEILGRIALGGQSAGGLDQEGLWPE